MVPTETSPLIPARVPEPSALASIGEDSTFLDDVSQDETDDTGLEDQSSIYAIISIFLLGIVTSVRVVIYHSLSGTRSTH